MNEVKLSIKDVNGKHEYFRRDTEISEIMTQSRGDETDSCIEFIKSVRTRNQKITQLEGMLIVPYERELHQSDTLILARQAKLEGSILDGGWYESPESFILRNPNPCGTYIFEINKLLVGYTSIWDGETMCDSGSATIELAFIDPKLKEFREIFEIENKTLRQKVADDW